MAEDGPAALLLDDAHLAGASTVDWLRFVAHRAPSLPLLVVAARRAEEGLPLPATATVTLGPLDLAAAEAVVGRERAGALFARSGGHPLFLIELAAADPKDELPASIREAVAERCDRAGPAAAARLAQGPSLVVASGWLGTLRVYQGRAEEGLELLHPVTLPGVPSPGFFRLRAAGMVG